MLIYTLTLCSCPREMRINFPSNDDQTRVSLNCFPCPPHLCSRPSAPHPSAQPVSPSLFHPGSIPLPPSASDPEMGVCHCDECQSWTYKDSEGVHRPGRYLDTKTIAGHALAQKQKHVLETAERGSDDDDTVRVALHAIDQDSNDQGLSGASRRAVRASATERYSLPRGHKGSHCVSLTNRIAYLLLTPSRKRTSVGAS